MNYFSNLDTTFTLRALWILLFDAIECFSYVLLLQQEKGALELLFDARVIGATAPVAATGPDGTIRSRADVDAEVSGLMTSEYYMCPPIQLVAEGCCF